MNSVSSWSCCRVDSLSETPAASAGLTGSDGRRHPLARFSPASGVPWIVGTPPKTSRSGAGFPPTDSVKKEDGEGFKSLIDLRGVCRTIVGMNPSRFSGSQRRGVRSRVDNTASGHALARGTPHSRPLGDSPRNKGISASSARLTRPPVHRVTRPKPTGGPVRMHEVTQRRPATPDRRPKHRPNRTCKCGVFRTTQGARRPQRMNTGPEQRLVRVDVPDPRHDTLVQQTRLDRGA